MREISRRKRMRTALLSTFLIFVLLITRIGWIQFVQGSELQTLAYTQQTLDRKINPKRGTIFDATCKNILATSATVETVTVNPTNINKNDKDKVAKALSSIFDIDYETVLKRVNKRSSIETIVKKVEKEKTDELRVWMKENNITVGINIDEDTKRYYPYNNLASQVIGFCGSDNQGLDGIEAKYDEILKGTQGKIVRVTDAKGGEVQNTTEQYIEAIDGKDIVLTIDMTIQSIAEKYLKEACIDNVCTDGGNIIIADPTNGDILAMATYPNYNLNTPYEINNEELKQVWNTLSAGDKNKNLQSMWRNKAIADTYEPGSTFKLVTASASLEEGITTTDKEGEFSCTGGIEIAGTRIKCWRYYRPHGSESLRQALMNSCNPVFIALGQRLGVQKYYEYLNKFGFLNKTGIDLPGEAKGIFLAEDKVGPVELATISFGQRFEVTPIQMISMVSTIANKGIRMKPTLVKEIIDTTTGERQEIEPVEAGRVISEETAKNVLSMMESVVAEGTGKNARVAGYSVGGKTGTSEDGVNTNKYVTSFIGVAPISATKVVILITLYNPTGEGGHQGGAVAAPIASQVLGEVLPYLELNKDNVIDEQEEAISTTVPDIRCKTIKEAKQILKEAGLTMDLQVEEYDEENDVITIQIPSPGIKVNTGNKVICEVN
ncbi:MAG: PASTA domain-containing protein [Clostridia bacterium]|nr:PASTA domain-containing protein [Clostridia bacterium]